MVRRNTAGLLVLGLIALGGAGLLLRGWGGENEPPPRLDRDPLVDPKVADPKVLPAQALEPIVEAGGQPDGQPETEPDTPDLPAAYYTKYPPNTRIEVQLPAVAQGIEVFPGIFVPPLNGVKVDDGIPPARRPRRMPPPGKVVAKVTGPDGQEYWEHEDGSLTSSTYSTIVNEQGVEEEVVAVQHGYLPAVRKSLATPGSPASALPRSGQERR